jgi:two-component system, LytTR family, response regulator
MDVLIVEDEPLAAERLKDLFSAVAPASKIVGHTASINETLQWLQRHPAPDLVMMDINLADGSCFSLFEVCDITAPVIFCTAYDEYALKAFQSNGIAYLLKPVVEADLRGALGKLEQLRQSLKRHGAGYRQVIRDIGAAGAGYKSRFLIRAGEKLLPILTSDIACFMAEEHGLKAYLLQGDSYFLDYTVVELESILNPKNFFRISRQAIISDQAVTSASANLRNARVSLEKIGLDLPIARERAKEFHEWLGR